MLRINKPLYLAAAADSVTIVPLRTEGRPTSIRAKVGDNVVDVPVTYLEKDVIEIGKYRHPVTKDRFEVDGKRIDHWAKQINDMIKAGIEIPTPIDHVDAQLARYRGSDPYVSAADNLGFVVGAHRVGGRLRLTHQVIGEDAVAKAMRNRASVYVLPEYIDEKGRKWTDCIVHSAYTPMPVVSGMGAFLPIAASHDGVKEMAPVFEPERDNTGVTTMVLDEQKLDRIRQEIVAEGTIGVAEAAEMDEDAIIEAMYNMLFGEESDEETDEEVVTAAGDLGVAPTGLSRAKLAKAYNATKASLKLARNGDGVKLDDETAADRLLDLDGKIDTMVTDGKLKPSQAIKAKAILRNGDKPNKLMLARVGGATDYPALTLIGLLAENPVAISGKAKTGNQKVALSREVVPDAVIDAQKLGEAYAQRHNKKKV